MKKHVIFDIANKIGSIFTSVTKTTPTNTSHAKSSQLSNRLKEEVAEMKMHQFSADNSEQRLQWSAIGPVYSTYYNMIETMIVSEINSFKSKYRIHLTHQLLPSGSGGTICRFIVHPIGTDKIYQADMSISVSVDTNNVKCVICRETAENVDVDLAIKGSAFFFASVDGLESRSSRMLASANMLMEIHNILLGIEKEIRIAHNYDGPVKI